MTSTNINAANQFAKQALENLGNQNNESKGDINFKDVMGAPIKNAINSSHAADAAAKDAVAGKIDELTLANTMNTSALKLEEATAVINKGLKAYNDIISSSM